jgi:hypothetical protein
MTFTIGLLLGIFIGAFIANGKFRTKVVTETKGFIKWAFSKEAK